MDESHCWAGKSNEPASSRVPIYWFLLSLKAACASAFFFFLAATAGLSSEALGPCEAGDFEELDLGMGGRVEV
jgi:hypothetical protein